MEQMRLGLVGCGGMGTRHIYGMHQLAQTPFNNIELCALCDVRRENAELAADEAEKLLGARPEIFTDLGEMARRMPGLAAVDVVTDPSAHHTVVCAALQLGLHVMVEKPMAITVRGCQLMLDAAHQAGRILSIAENFRRDPSARLANHLIRTGAIGSPYMGLFHSLAAGNHIFITPWRHQRDKGGFILDLGVHFTDLIRYQLGDIVEVYGDARLVEPIRHKPEKNYSNYKFYEQRFAAMDDQIDADADDTTQAVFKMANGATVNWLVGSSGHGGTSGECILGKDGSIQGFGGRGGTISLKQRGQEMTHEQILAAHPDFTMDPLTAHMFPSGISRGDPNTDLKLLAYQQHELAAAVLDNRKVEVDGIEGLKDVAAIYAILESSSLRRAVTMTEIENGDADLYQQPINQNLGIN
ncbi:MAG: hypothetical protein CMJ49_06445 [Planctomycetaceae bacterium]|nr:hypothetical protein [Planctomycetaceae bacterium]